MPRIHGRLTSLCCANREEVITNKSSRCFMSDCSLHLLAHKSSRLVDRFDQRQAAPAFHAVAKWSVVGFDGADEVFDCVPVSTDVAHYRRRCAWILIAGIGADQ